MEGNGGGGSEPMPRGVGMHRAPATSPPYPPPFLPSPCGHGQMQQQQEKQQQQGLTCLKLGKRPCFWGESSLQAAQGSDGGGGVEGKRKDKTAAGAAAVPRCQVEGCDVALADARDYHRRHKVCEMHSKAPRVVVHGAEQRFCQQCSRFHAISEFDDAKRSCRRRLAGHNERRRKSNASEAMARGSAHPHGVPAMGHGFPPYGMPTSPAGALSLLSSARSAAGPWMIPTPDISARSSAALDELIAENRALLAWQFFTDRPQSAAGYPMAGGWHAHMARAPTHEAAARAQQEPASGHVTLDLMQATATTAAAGAPFRPVAARPAKEGGDDAGCTSDVWTSSSSSSMEGARVV